MGAGSEASKTSDAYVGAEASKTSEDQKRKARAERCGSSCHQCFGLDFLCHLTKK
ncbi:hypothetical protein SOVF_173290 isoform B [Spinacia oleracea]|nr:hypothetical protein SOVF_173290 isoform B [Spinacia oleracea]